MMHVLYDSKYSGNAWKVRMLLSHLNLPFRRVTYTLAEGGTKTPEFLAKNPLGKIPVLELPSGQTIFESNAILCHLADGTVWLPGGIDRARVMQWLFFEQAEVVKTIGSCRYWVSIAKRAEEKATEIAAWQSAGRKVLGILDAHLATNEFMVTERCTIADLALFPYISLAPNGGFKLEHYPNVVAWLKRVRGLPGHVPLTETGENHG